MHDLSRSDCGGAQADEAEEGRTTARLLRDRAALELFSFLALAAADGRWKVFVAALSELADISENGIEVLLEKPEPSLGWSHLYNAAGLPRSLFNFFIQFVSVARRTPSVASPTRRQDVFRAARAVPEAANAPVPDTFWKTLSSQ